MKENPLDTRGSRKFLRQFWQKKPLFTRAVFPQIDSAIDRAKLIELACRDDVESRLVMGAGKSWRVEHGPFRQRDFARLPQRNWTLLVNGIENFVPAARQLQQQFSFVPYARHDDVMVSYAVPGGGVGPHFDSYDVFLLQGSGTRRWKISGQDDLEIVADAPLKILRRFRSQREWTAAPGDMLYLPPNYAHHGVAVNACFTWSIGFRAPGKQEMAARFLDYLHDHLQLDGDYRDPGLKSQSRPAAIDGTMLRKVRAMVNAIHWSESDIVRCLGEYLTEPRSNVIFRPSDSTSAQRFARLAAARGVRLALKSRMLFRGGVVFINGETVKADRSMRHLLQKLANERSLPPVTRMDNATRDLLCQWYRAGYIEIG